MHDMSSVFTQSEVQQSSQCGNLSGIVLKFDDVIYVSIKWLIIGPGHRFMDIQYS